MLHEDSFGFGDDTRIIKHKRVRDFTIISNACINDKNLPGEALAILVYVMSKPDDWEIKTKDVAKRFTIGRDKTYNLINKLNELGYMKRVQARNSDGSMSSVSIFASDQPIFLPSNLIDKQPLPDFQEPVTEKVTYKQPLPGLPDPGFQEAVSLYTNKELNKENNNNKIITNPKGACATPVSDNLTNTNPEASVVVFFMKKIEGSGVPENTLFGWLSKYGEAYVAEKIRIYQSKGTMTNPGGFLSAAIRYDWKEKTVNPVTKPADNNSNLTEYPTLNENQNWFKKLSKAEKAGLEQLVILQHPIFPQMLSNANPKLSILDEGFPESFLFKMMMEVLGRAKR